MNVILWRNDAILYVWDCGQAKARLLGKGLGWDAGACDACGDFPGLFVAVFVDCFILNGGARRALFAYFVVLVTFGWIKSGLAPCNATAVHRERGGCCNH